MVPVTETLLGLLPALLFFVIVPLGGAFAVRARWRAFRRKLLVAAQLPRIDYALAHDAGDEFPEDRPVAVYGRLEGIQGERGIWLGSNGISVLVDLHRVPIFLLPKTAGAAPSFPDETPRVVYWREMNALVEGSRFFVAGTVARDRGTLRIRGWDAMGGVPLVIMYDCADTIVFERAMWTGRQRNEYWNHITPVSLIVGFLAEVLWVLRVFDESRLDALIGIVAALVPILPLIPPGVVGFYVYRRMWRRGRRIRAARDMRLLRNGNGRDTAAYRRETRIATAYEAVALGIFVTAIAVNAYLGAIVLAILLR